MARKVRISQCMIVKNEEANIRQALSWGKGIVWEQIVVDTGSTDKTVEIAKEMGAKVFHFEWCDDFSAAKNYAIEQASGEWIAFLDADEYFSGEDARKLPGILKKIELLSGKGSAVHIIRMPWLHLDDEGKVFSVGQQDRIFRNMKNFRFQGRIHEALRMTDGKPFYYALAENLSIMHMGYRQSVCGDKGLRNIPLLEKEVEENPENYNAWSYLGEAHAGCNHTEEALSCMERVMGHVMECGIGNIMEDRVNSAFSDWFSEVSYLPDDEIKKYEERARRYYDGFSRTGIVFPDVEFFMGRILLRVEKQAEGIQFFELALNKLEQYKDSSSLTMAGKLDFVYNVLQAWYEGQGDAQKSVYYGTLSLRFNRYQEDTLSTLLQLFKNDANTAAEQVVGFLKGMYQFENLKDKLFVLKVAMKIGYEELEEEIRRSMSEEELAWLMSE